MSTTVAAREAVAIALRIHDEAMAMNREHGFEMFDVSAQPDAFIAALEAMDPPFTIAAAPLWEVPPSCTCPLDRDESYAGTCPVHDVHGEMT